MTSTNDHEQMAAYRIQHEGALSHLATPAEGTTP